MTQEEWHAIERTLSGLTVRDRLELASRLIRSIQADVGQVKTDGKEQSERLTELRRKLASMPTATVADGPS